MLFVFFFFSSRRRHTRSLRDWSSDVCSSDLGRTWWRAGLEAALRTSVMALPIIITLVWRSETHGGQTIDWFNWKRSEERRVGKECRYRCWRYHEKKKQEIRRKEESLIVYTIN